MHESPCVGRVAGLRGRASRRAASPLYVVLGRGRFRAGRGARCSGKGRPHVGIAQLELSVTDNQLGKGRRWPGGSGARSFDLTVHWPGTIGGRTFWVRFPFLNRISILDAVTFRIEMEDAVGEIYHQSVCVGVPAVGRGRENRWRAAGRAGRRSA